MYYAMALRPARAAKLFFFQKNSQPPKRLKPFTAPSRKTELLEAERAKDEVRDILTRMIGSEIRYTQIGYWSRAALYGYETSKLETVNGKRAILVPQTDQAPIIRKMYDMRASGVYSDDQIADEMNRLGFQTPIKVIRDKLDRTKIVRRSGGKKMTGKLLRVYVAKTIYAGVNTEKWTGDKPVLCKFDGLVSIELWNKANRGKISIALNPDDPDHPNVTRAPKQEKFAKKNVYNEEFPYRKVVLCPECSNPLLGGASRGKSGKYYPAYHCSHHGHYFRVPKGEFDDKINQFIERVIVDPARFDEVLKAVQTVWEQRQVRVQDEGELRDKKRDRQPGPDQLAFQARSRGLTRVRVLRRYHKGVGKRGDVLRPGRTDDRDTDCYL